MRRTVPPSAEIEEQIDQLLAVGVGENPRESLSELAKLGARLIIQRAVEDEFDAWLGRARYDRRPEYQRGLRNYESGLRNGFRPRRVQTAEGELQVEIPQVREAAETFASKLLPEDTEAVADRAVEGAGDRRVRQRVCRCAMSSRCASRLGWASCRSRPRRGSARSCSERFEAFKRRSLYDTGWWRCSSTRRSSPCVPAGPRRASWSPGDSPKTANACCWR